MARTVLVMDDDESVREIFTFALSDAGYQVDTAATLSDADELLNKKQFDVFLCDINMGHERSLGLLREWQALIAAGKTQVVVVSAEDQFREMCEQLGIEFFISKPVDVKVLLRLLERLKPQQDGV